MGVKLLNFFIILIFSIQAGLSVAESNRDPNHELNKEKDYTMTFDYKKQTDEFWKKHLSGEAYHICRARGTEVAGTGQYDKFYEEGTYHCACCRGDFPLFSSETKFDSGTGWPSFYAPFDEKSVALQEDDRLIHKYIYGARVEVLRARCGSHLGHVFEDGPKPTGKRYCMNFPL